MASKPCFYPFWLCCLLSGASCGSPHSAANDPRAASVAPASARRLGPAPRAEGSRPVEGDYDGDGLVDDEDLCPTVAEDQDRCDDEDGCPDPDDDGDGTLDVDDQCRFEPGARDNHGCKKPLPIGNVYVENIANDDACLVLNAIAFKKNLASLDPDGQKSVSAVSSCMTQERSLLLLEVRGHQSKRESGSELALERAQVVAAALAAQGIDPKRLRPTAGHASPPRQTSLGEQVVEFIVLRMMTCPVN
jgi:OmpA-OmpF porin, OOP family